MTQPARSAQALLFEMSSRAGSPLSVVFQITDRCNYQCAHCYETHGRGEGELALAEIERILDELAAEGVLFLSVTGGEPFVRKDCEEILAAAVARRFATKLKTTGHFIDAARAERLAKLGIAEVQISVYAADPAIHDGVTGFEGSLARSLAAAERLRANGVAVVFAMPLMAANVEERDRVREVAHALGAELTTDPKLTAREDGDEGPLALRMTDEQVRRVYSDETLNRKPLAASRRLVAAGLPARPQKDLDDSPCLIGQKGCHVNPRGQVYGCTALALPVGDLRRQTFHEIWTGSRELQRLRAIRWRDLRGCNECDVRQYCQRCNAMALNEDGDLLGPSSEACRHAVALREALREKGLVPENDRALPPGFEVKRRFPSLRVVAS